MMDTQQSDFAKQLQEQTLQVAIDQAVLADDIEVPRFVPTNVEGEKRAGNEKKGGVSPLSGAPTPPGRPKGVRNKLTNIRDAVIEAFETVGGAEYLVRLANGTQSDRAAFSSLVAKVLPTQINQTVDGGIRLELSWLGSRQIGTTTAQIAEERTQVLDLQQENDGSYRIKDQAAQSAGGEGQAAPTAQKAAGDAQGEGQ